MVPNLGPILVPALGPILVPILGPFLALIWFPFAAFWVSLSIPFGSVIASMVELVWKDSAYMVIGISITLANAHLLFAA